MAAEDTAKADACKEYQSSLEDLTFNSKPHINNLTILAEENLKYSPEIVKLIEAQITKAPASEKLPVMYLMDSIVKNVGGSYISLFAQNLSPIFSSVFEKVDESTRKSLFKLRSTWDEMFQLTKLYALDVKINKLDPAWPIKPLPPNVNSSSIHVNPKFLNRSLEEPTTSSSTVAPINSAKQNIAESQKNVTQEQEQFIRQQLLAKQKQLLELQQKKLELELEQTKAQLMASLASQHTTPDSAVNLGHAKLHVPITKVSPMLSIGTGKPTPATVRPLQQESTELEKLQAPNVSDTKASNRDPRINRLSQQSTHSKDPVKKESQLQTEKLEKAGSKRNSPAGGSSERAESQISMSKQEKDKTSEKLVRKESKGSEGKSKLVSPAKNKLPVKNTKKTDTEKVKVEVSKRDPRLRKSSQDKTDKVETKEKRTNVEKKEDDQSKGAERKPSAIRNKAINGILLKNEKDGKEVGKDVSKSGGFNFRSHSRSSRSRSPRSRSPRSRSPISRSPVSRSARQRGRLSPKRRRASVSPLSKTQEKEKSVKRPLSDEYKQNTNNWERRDVRKKGNTKPEVRDPRKLKRTREDRCQEQQVARPENRNSPRSSPEPKENVENWHDQPSAKRWKSGWEEAKSLKQKQETPSHGKFPHQPKEVYSGSKGILSPRTPRQQRMSVDANLQIPKELTSANKRDLLKKANQRLAAGEISYDEFLVVAHQINQLFQYQEEKSRSSDWQGTHVTPRGFKTELKGESPLARTQGKGTPLSEAEMSYLEHMSKLKRTRVQLEQSHEIEPRWKTREAHNKDVSGDLSLSNREDGDQGSKSPNVASPSYSLTERHDTRGTCQERKPGEKRETSESGRGHYSEGRHSERRKLCDVKPARRSPAGDNRQLHEKHCDHVSPLRQRMNPLVDEERNQSNVRDSKKHVDEKLIKQVKSSPNPEERYKIDSNHGKLCNNWIEPRNEHLKDQRQGSKHQPVVEKDLQEFGPRDGQDIKREESRSHCDRHSEERPYDATQRSSGLVESTRLRSGAHEMPQRFREIADRPGQGKSGSGRNLEKLRTEESIESDRTWLRSRNGSPSCDGCIAGSRVRLQEPPEQVIQPIDGAPEQPCHWIEGIPRQPNAHFDGPGGSRIGQPGACFDGPHRGLPGVCFDCPGSLHLGQPGVRFDGPGGPRSGLRFDSSRLRQPGPRFDGPRMGQPGLRFDGPRPGQPGLRFEGPHPGQPGTRFGGPHPGQPGTCFDSPCGHPGQSGIHFEGPQSGPRIDSSHPGQPCGHYDSPGGHPGQTGARFGPHSGQLGSQLDNPGNHRGHARFDPHPGQPAIHFDGPHPRQPGTRFDSPDGLGQPCMRFDGPQPGHPNMRFDGLGPRLRQPVTCFDGPHPGQPNTHFDGLGGRPAQCAVRFDGPQIGQAGTHFDSSGSHPGQPAIRFDGPAGTRYDIISTQPGTFFDNARGPQFEGTSMNPDPRCSVAGHLFNGHPPSSQYQGRVFDGQPGPRFNVPQGSHYNESAVHGATTLANPAYGPTGPCFEGQTSIPRLAGPHNNDQYDSACGTFYNNNLPASLPENMRQLQPVNTMTGFSHNPIPFSQSQQYVTPQSSVPVSQIQQGSSFAPLENHLGQLDVNELFSKLLSTGILKPNPVDSAPTQSDVVPEGDSQVQTTIEDDEEEENEENIPDLTGFQIEELKQRYDGVIGRLYTGIQCYSCGMRFTASQTDVYADHLDWHYRMNRMEKDITKKVTYRKWYYSLTDWIEFEEIADLEERAKSQFFEKVHEEVVQRTQEAAKEKEFQSVPAGPAGVHEVCEICQEAFEQYWDEDEEEWHLKNAIRVDSRTYHPACYEDYKNASFTDTTPSPSEAPIENPLHSVLKQEQLTGSSKTSDATNSCEDTGNERSCVLTNDNKTEKDSAPVKVEAV
ncbi:pre-mRNA cleavage complex 2 protein Pcf11 isoform X2 [Hemiscyllium ocellatum]|uniref:pre-mRNA cleavage complex 2 protein Pcf11 isoform X2 n=1 Tax=Hemiscyllium ocellatum TaxID=170820 RepID=UPI0029667603|nr:pre-mRNA cleavage complex 2 protein Pcf11 isoform X2 [Hemiscyllium ocellatum]